MSIVQKEIERLMALANSKKMELQAVGMAEETDSINNINFYINNEKIDYSDLIKVLENKKKQFKLIKEENSSVAEFINTNYNQWNSIKNKKDWEEWKEESKKYKTGTYYQFNLKDSILKILDDKKINSILEQAYLKELDRVLKA